MHSNISLTAPFPGLVYFSLTTGRWDGEWTLCFFSSNSEKLGVFLEKYYIPLSFEAPWFYQLFPFLSARFASAQIPPSLEMALPFFCA